MFSLLVESPQSSSCLPSFQIWLGWHLAIGLSQTSDPLPTPIGRGASSRFARLSKAKVISQK